MLISSKELRGNTAFAEQVSHVSGPKAKKSWDNFIKIMYINNVNFHIIYGLQDKIVLRKNFIYEENSIIHKEFATNTVGNNGLRFLATIKTLIQKELNLF